MRVSFSGIHDIRFPYGTTTKEIKKKQDDIQNVINEKYPSLNNSVSVQYMNYFDIQKTEQKLAQDGLRMFMAFENPYVTANILEDIDEKLLQQYINQTKTELII